MPRRVLLLAAAQENFPPALFCSNCERRTQSGFIISQGLDGPYLLKEFPGYSVKLDGRGVHVKFAHPACDPFAAMIKRNAVPELIRGFRNELDIAACLDTEVMNFLDRNPGLRV